MNQIRFIIALAILLLILLVFRFVTQPFAPEKMISPVAEALGILVIGLIWGGIIYLPIRLFQGPDKSPDFQSFIFYVAAIFSALFLVYHLIR